MDLFSPLGDKYVTDSQTEITRLKAQGYSEKRPTPTQVAVNNGEKAPKNPS